MGFLPDRLAVIVKVGGLISFWEKQPDGSYITKKIPYENFIAGIGNSPIELDGEAGNFSYTFDANTFITYISAIKVSGSPTLKIGTTPNDNDILDTILISSFQFIDIHNFCQISEIFYFTLSGGVINLRIDLIPNYITIS